MSYIKNVYGEFKLAENKVIEFPMLKSHTLRTALEESETNKSYLADIAYIDAFSNVIENYQTPVISKDNVLKEEYIKKIKSNIESIKINSLTWKDSLKVQLKSSPENIKDNIKILNTSIKIMDRNLEQLKTVIAMGDEDLKKIILENFYNSFDGIIKDTNSIMGISTTVLNKINIYENSVSTQAKNIENNRIFLVDIDDKFKGDIEEIKKKIKSLEKQKKEYTNIAIGTGVAGGVVGIGCAVGVFAAPELAPFFIVVFIFAGGALFGGCTVAAIEAQKIAREIELITSEMDNKDKNRLSIELMISTMKDWAKQTSEVCEKLKEIFKAWEDINKVFINIKDEVSKIKEKSKDADKHLADIENDINVVLKIKDSVEKTIDGLTIDTTDLGTFDVSDCKTEEDIKAKLKVM